MAVQNPPPTLLNRGVWIHLQDQTSSREPSAVPFWFLSLSLSCSLLLFSLIFCFCSIQVCEGFLALFGFFFLPSVFTRYSMLIVPHLDGYFWCVCRRRWAQRLTPPPSSYLPFVYFGKRILVTFFSAEPIWKILLVHFKCTILCLPAPISPSILLKLGSHKSVLHVCESGSILQTC